MCVAGTVVRVSAAIAIIIAGLWGGGQIIRAGTEMNDIMSVSRFEGEGGTTAEAYYNEYGNFLNGLGYVVIFGMLGLAVIVSGLPSLFSREREAQRVNDHQQRRHPRMEEPRGVGTPRWREQPPGAPQAPSSQQPPGAPQAPSSQQPPSAPQAPSSPTEWK
jgi:hypothetical protein